MSVKRGAKGAYHAEGYDFLAFVGDNDADNPANPDDDLELAVYCPRRLGGIAGLDPGWNSRYAHVGDLSGGFTPNK
jgi:hypothetical protein